MAMAKVGAQPIALIIACVSAAAFVCKFFISCQVSSGGGGDDSSGDGGKRFTDTKRGSDCDCAADTDCDHLERPCDANVARSFTTAASPGHSQQSIDSLAARNAELEAKVASLAEENDKLAARLARYANKKKERRHTMKRELEATVASLSEENAQMLVAKLAEEKQSKNERRKTQLANTKETNDNSEE